MMDVTHVKTPTTSGIRPRHPTEAEEKPVDETRQRVLHTGSSELDLTCCTQSRSSANGCRDLVIDYVAAKKMVKFLCGTRDTALQLV